MASGRALKKYNDGVKARSMQRAQGEGSGSGRPKPRDEADDDQLGREKSECDDLDVLEGYISRSKRT